MLWRMSAGILMETSAIMSISQHTATAGLDPAASGSGMFPAPYSGTKEFPARKPDSTMCAIWSWIDP